MSKSVFDGKGFNENPLSSEESAQVRHMYSEVKESWQALENIVIVARAFTILYDIIKVGGPILLILAFIGAWLKAQGAI